MTRTVKIIDAACDAAHPRVSNDDVPGGKAAISRRFWKIKNRVYTVSNPSGLSVTEGDTVEIYLPPGRTVLSAALTFILPLILFPLGYSLGREIFKSLSLPDSLIFLAEGEFLPFVLGFTFLLIGIPLGAVICRIAGFFNEGPAITRVLSPAELSQCSNEAAEGCGHCGGQCT